MEKNKAKSIKSIANGNRRKNIAGVRSLHRRFPAGNRRAVKNTADTEPAVKYDAFAEKIIGPEIDETIGYPEDIAAIETAVPDIFLTSLRNLTRDDIIPGHSSAHKKKKADKIIVNLMLAVCAAVFIFSGYKLVEKMIGYGEAAESYDNIRYLFYEENEEADSEFAKLQKSRRNHASVELLTKMEAPEEAVAEEDYEDYETAEAISEIEKTRYSLQALAAINPDTYGWLHVSELKIDYPVVKTSDNEYYLKHNFNKIYNESGAIFADFHNVKVPDNRHTILYGHNMSDGTMFQNLLSLRYNKSLLENTVIELGTMDGIFVYKIFSVYKTEPTYNYIKTEFQNDEEWLNFLAEINEKSLHKTDIVFMPGDKILTLSTCTNTWDDGRFAVHAILVEVRK